jgi:hypothetical protein
MIESDPVRQGRADSDHDPFAGVSDERLGAVLWARRDEASLSAAEAAAGADIGFGDLVEFESGSRRPDPATVIRLLGQYRGLASQFPLRRRSGHRGVGRSVRA